jgi:hypothetical protein
LKYFVSCFLNSVFFAQRRQNPVVKKAVHAPRAEASETGSLAHEYAIASPGQKCYRFGVFKDGQHHDDS